MSAGEVSVELGDLPNPIILLVEDEVFVRLATAELLRDEGYVVVEAVDALEALVLVDAAHPFDLVLSDVRMPGEMDGIGLAQTIKHARPHLPVVLLTSHLPAEAVHPADAVLMKPYHPEQLLGSIRAMIVRDDS